MACATGRCNMAGDQSFVNATGGRSGVWSVNSGTSSGTGTADRGWAIGGKGSKTNQGGMIEAARQRNIAASKAGTFTVQSTWMDYAPYVAGGVVGFVGLRYLGVL